MGSTTQTRDSEDLSFAQGTVTNLNPRGWPGGGGLGLVGVLPMRSQVRIRSGANNSLEPSDLGEALDLTVVYLWETCLPRPCALPGLVRPSGLDTRRWLWST
uniref:Uncharacterized protein n=1 Tax=Salix viminalis TaxID=40686 RepID=A0A6N2LIV2_SALVM